MTKKIFLSLMAVLGLLLSAHAQEREITGSVKDHAGAGIVGATILVEGTNNGETYTYPLPWIKAYGGKINMFAEGGNLSFIDQKH